MENDEKKIWNDGGPCHACGVKILPHDLEAKTVLCEEAGWITLCKDCPVYVQCYKCDENVHPDKTIVVGECAGYYDHACINDEGETYNCDELKKCSYCDEMFNIKHVTQYQAYPNAPMLSFCEECHEETSE